MASLFFFGAILIMSLSWIAVIGILSVIFYFVKIILSTSKLFRKVGGYILESNQNFNAIQVYSSTSTSMYAIL